MRSQNTYQDGQRPRSARGTEISMAREATSGRHGTGINQHVAQEAQRSGFFFFLQARSAQYKAHPGGRSHALIRMAKERPKCKVV